MASEVRLQSMKSTACSVGSESNEGPFLNIHRVSLVLCKNHSPVNVPLHTDVGRDNKHHATIRKAVNPAFSPSALKELEPLIERRMDQFVNSLQTLSERTSGTVNMSEWFENLAFSVSRAMQCR